MRFTVGFAVGVAAGVIAAPWLVRLLLKHIEVALPALPNVEPEYEYQPWPWSVTSAPGLPEGWRVQNTSNN